MVQMKVTARDLRSMLQIYAKIRGVRINPNEKTVISVVNKLLSNTERRGFPYCPCRRVSGDPLKRLVCPCIHMVAEVRRHGKCLCNLFLKK